MADFLVIVESPTKAKTISSILGKQYEVVSSMGHIVDLPARSLGINIEDGFTPSYVVIPKKKKLAASLKKHAKNKRIIYLATDLDREGEAISWHIRNLLTKGKDEKDYQRVIFHEITEEAVREAFQHPGELDMRKVDAQKIRRVMDRIVGYYLSPLLWKKIVRGLSAGRVQSVALKFIVEREKERQQFIPVTTYEIEAVFRKGDEAFKAKLKKYNNEKAVFATREEAQSALEALKNQQFSVTRVDKKELHRRPPPPFTTSLLQQEAFNKLRFSSKKTMLVAQRLYEGKEVAGKMLGLITYMRTDSFYVADKAKGEVRDFITDTFGAQYLPAQEHVYKEKKSAQLAHEAIRPTSSVRDPSSVKDYLAPEENRLYELIWKRFVAAFMKEATFESLSVTINGDDGIFSVQGRRVVFDGFLRVAGQEEEKIVPLLHSGDQVVLENITIAEKTTQPPPRFTDASLVKLLEEKGIGRPSTYAPIISTLIMRNYVRKDKGFFSPTDLGVKVCDLLVDNFPDIMDEKFTAQIEGELDKIEDGSIAGQTILSEFYPPFKKELDAAMQSIKKHVDLVDKLCPQCGRQLMVKWSRRGKFLSCTGFPECKYAESITTDVLCPLCKTGKLIRRRNRRGQFFYGCSQFPSCRYTSRTLPSEGAQTESQDEE